MRAPGKINLFLEVGGAGDDGYHAVATAYQAVSVYEDVVAEHAADFTIAVSGPESAGVPLDGTNLALRAARLLAEHTGYPDGVRLSVQKHVPVAGGMGGGSADAAAALVACDILWGTGVPGVELAELAARLGADVPFSLLGGTAIGVGRGDRLSPALAKGRFEWVIVVSDTGLSTPAVYHELDRLRALHTAPVPRDPAIAYDVLQALRTGDPRILADTLRNDLQRAAVSLQPNLAAVLELGEASGALAGIVSGSGPTLAFLCADVEAALDLRVTLSAAGYDARHVHGPVAGARAV